MGLSRVWVAALAAMVLSACGGGGGGGESASNASTRDPLPTLAQDINPNGERLDYRDRNYFPAAAGDSWTYDRQPGGVSAGQTLTKTVTAGAGSDVVISEASLGTSDSATYRRTADGILEVLPFAGSVPEAANQIVGSLLEYPEPFYPVGSVRRLIRQGGWGADLDGDGVSDSFRLEISQTLVGIETLNLPSGPLTNVAHFRNVVSFTLQPSALKNQSVSLVATEEAWWAPNIGLARAERSAVDSTGVVQTPAYTIVLSGGTVSGAELFAPPAVRIPLVHNALVFDRAHNRYYASIPGSVTANGNRIAMIDPVGGTVTYSSVPVGSEPFAMALSADGSALYVGLNGSGDVLKLHTSDLAELWRARLPNVNFYGQLFAEGISVSPTDSDVVAVSMFRAGVSPRHGGVALIRAGVVQPTMTQDHTGSNLIAFDASGQHVYGLNNETTEFGLRRIAVVPTGLVQEQVVTASSDFGTRRLDWSSGGLVLGNAVYRSPDLALLGQVNVQGGGCRAHSVPNRIVCAYNVANSGQDAALAVVDATTFVILATPVYQRGYGSNSLSEIVAGPPGQVAMRMNATYVNSPSDAVWLFTSPDLQ